VIPSATSTALAIATVTMPLSGGADSGARLDACAHVRTLLDPDLNANDSDGATRAGTVMAPLIGTTSPRLRRET